MEKELQEIKGKYTDNDETYQISKYLKGKKQ
jgi:hypothetical protein